MSKFLTPPVWYDRSGNLVEILTGGMLDAGVVFTNSMAIGKDSVVAGNHSTAVGGGASVYGDNSTAIGSNTYSYSSGCVAIGSEVTVAPDEGTIGSIAIGKGNKVYGDGSIAIGEGIKLGSDTNPLNYTIQIGSSDKTYSAQIGNGSGTLQIGSIAFQKMTIYSRNSVSIGSRGVYLCCTTSGPKVSRISNVAIFFINDINNTASVLSSSDGSCSYDHINHVIKSGTDFTIEYCFKIVSL